MPPPQNSWKSQKVTPPRMASKPSKAVPPQPNLPKRPPIAVKSPPKPPLPSSNPPTSTLHPGIKRIPRTAPSARPRTSPLPAPPPRLTPARTLFRIARASVLFGAIFLTVRDHVVSFDTVNGASMSPTLSPHVHETGEKDKVVIYHWRAGERLQRGDVITFWKPHRPGEISIKRVVAVAGDEVVPRRRELGPGGWRGDAGMEARKGGVMCYTDRKGGGWNSGLAEEDDDVEFASGKQDLSASSRSKSVTIPYNHIWVEGDNWRQSYDSNDFGPVSQALVDGKAVAVIRGWKPRGIDKLQREEGEQMRDQNATKVRLGSGNVKMETEWEV